MTIQYTVRRGKARGTTLTPHRNKQGMFVASRDKYKTSHVPFSTAVAAFDYALAKGWGIRMSAGGKNRSFIKASQCDV